MTLHLYTQQPVLDHRVKYVILGTHSHCNISIHSVMIHVSYLYLPIDIQTANFYLGTIDPL